MASKGIYKFARKLIARICKNKDITYTYDFDKEEYLNKQVIVIADHAATDAYLYVLNGFMSDGICPVVGENNAYNLGTKFLLDRIDSITKKLFIKDGVAVRKILKTLKEGRSLLLFPEGIQSLCGTTSPIIPSTYALLKKAKLDVIIAKTKGTYLVNPRYNRNKYKGHTEVEYKILFKREELDNISIDEIKKRLVDGIKYNDFIWNVNKGYEYSGKKALIDGITNVIHYCPKCESVGNLQVIDESIKCKKCSNEVEMDSFYNIKAKSNNDVLPFERLDQWFNYQRDIVRRDIQKDDFEEKAFVELLKFRKYLFGKQYKKVSEGTLFIDKTSFLYTDDKYQKFSFCYKIKDLPSLPFNSQVAMQVYINDELYLLKPIANPSLTCRYIMEVQELHRLVDEEWEEAYKLMD